MLNKVVLIHVFKKKGGVSLYTAVLECALSFENLIIFHTILFLFGKYYDLEIVFNVYTEFSLNISNLCYTEKNSIKVFWMATRGGFLLLGIVKIVCMM